MNSSNHRNWIWALATAATFVMSVATRSEALPIASFSGASGSLSASVTFEKSGTNLIVTLTNTSTGDPANSAAILTAVFFTVNGDPTLTPASALLGAGSTVIHVVTQPTGGVVGGEWAYKNGLSGAPGGADEGISSAGLSPLFGAVNFPGSDLDGNSSSVDGIGYGITTVNDAAGNDNGGIATLPLIQNQVVFTLSGLPVSDLGFGITNVSFQYGTALTEPNFPPVGTSTVIPEPTTLLLLGSGLFGMPLLRRRRAQRG